MSGENKIEGLGGWLIIVGIVIIYDTLNMCYDIFVSYVPIFTTETWEKLTSPSSDAYNALWGPFIIGELCINICLIGLFIVLVYLFFTKNHKFPKLFISLKVIVLLLVVVDVWFVTLISPERSMFDADSFYKFLVKAWIAFIWISYILKSVRVKNTFVNKRKTSDPVNEQYNQSMP